MASKAPAGQFYWADWLRDSELQSISAASRGIWINLLCHMWFAKTRGRIIGTKEELQRLANCADHEFDTFLHEISRKLFGNKRLRGENIVLECRRMMRDEKARQNTNERVKKHRCNADVTDEKQGCSNTLHSSSSSSSSCTKVHKHNTAHFEQFWQAYPKKKSKGQAEKAFNKIKPDEQLLATMIATIEQARKSEQWMKEDGQFIPYPATWLNAKGWEDEDVGPPRPDEIGADGLRNWERTELAAAAKNPDYADMLRDSWRTKDVSATAKQILKELVVEVGEMRSEREAK